MMDLIKRSRVVSTGTIPSTVTVIYSKVASLTDFARSIPSFNERMSGYWGFTADLVFTLQVSATKFHQGLLCLSWEYSHSGPTRTVVPACMHLPNVCLNIGVDDIVQLRVPYLSTREFNVFGDTYAHGRVAVSSILPVLVGAGGSPAVYRLSVQLENIRTVGTIPFVENIKTFVAQVGEFEKEQSTGKVSSSLSGLSQAMTFVSKGVPSLSSVAAPAAWLLEASSRTAKAFGYSKPLVKPPATRFTPFSTAFEHNVDVPSTSVSLSAFADNHLAVGTTFSQSDHDEMAILGIVKRFSPLATGVFKSAATAGTTLYSTWVSPSCFVYRDTTAMTSPGGAYYSAKPSTSNTKGKLVSNVFFVASPFSFWRGGFRFRVTFAKTQIHGGKIMACFIPGRRLTRIDPGAPASTVAPMVVPAVGTSPGVELNGYTQTFDLGKTTVFEFDVPYMGTSPFSQFSQAVGTFSLTVVQPMQFASTVSSTVNFLVEVAALDDFEVAVLGSVRTFPTAGTFESQCGASQFVEQVGLPTLYPHDVAQNTVGERFNSIKQLIMLPKKTTITDVMTSRKGAYSFHVAPWYYYPTTAGLPEPNTSAHLGRGCEAFSIPGYFATAYAYVKGSTEAHVYLPDSPAISAVATYESRHEEPCGWGVSNRPAVHSHQGVLHVRFPAYQHLFRNLAAYWNGSLWAPIVSSWANHSSLYPVIAGTESATSEIASRVDVLVSSVSPSTSWSGVLKRQAGDDAALGVYLGPPPMYVPGVPVKDSSYNALIDNSIGPARAQSPMEEQVGALFSSTGVSQVSTSITFPAGVRSAVTPDLDRVQFEVYSPYFLYPKTAGYTTAPNVAGPAFSFSRYANSAYNREAQPSGVSEHDSALLKMRMHVVFGALIAHSAPDPPPPSDVLTLHGQFVESNPFNPALQPTVVAT